MQARTPFKAVAKIGSSTLAFLSELYRITLFLVEALAWLARPPFRFKVFLDQFYEIANKSLFIVSVTALFSGMVFAVQFYYGFELVQADALVGPSSALSLSREIAPVFTAIVVTGRSGASMAAEIGSMKVSEQIDAMDVMSVNSIQYLVTPRIIMGTLALPLLSILFLFLGNIGSYFVSVYVLDINAGMYFAHFQRLILPQDVLQGIIKAAFFGLMFSTLGTYFGYQARHGSQAVGLATTRAVVSTLVLILVSDYFLTLLIRLIIY
jgi:phospholipid/cholesterol/gamma-HCH transport system permease protein